MTFGVAALLWFFAFEIGHGGSSTSGHDCGSVFNSAHQTVAVFAKACNDDHTGATFWMWLLTLAGVGLVVAGIHWQLVPHEERRPSPQAQGPGG
jgi:hypothetical protein